MPAIKIKPYRVLRPLLILIGTTLVSFSIAVAQPGDPGGDPDNPVPISGIELLIAAGALLGFKKIKNISKKK
jgi:LPXTG-motif cell wall-anchored protein